MHVVGVLTFLLVAAAAGYVLWRAARRAGVLVPVAVGFGVRAALVLITRFVSQRSGHLGFLYPDDHGYSNLGKALATLWTNGDEGNLLQPLGILPHGGPLFYHLVAGVFLWTGNSVLAMQLVNVLAGTATILLGALLAGRLLGERRTQTAAWALALAPTVVWWTIPMLREALATFFAIASIYAASFAPRWRALIPTVVILAMLAFTRSTLFAAVGGGIMLWWLIVAVRERKAMPLTGIATFAATSAVVLGLTLYVASGSSGDVSSAVNIAGHSLQSYRTDAGRSAGPKGGAPRHGPGARRKAAHKKNGKTPARPATTTPAQPADFQSPFAADLAKGGVSTYGAALVRFFVSPRAWALTTVPFDWYQPLYPSMWLWYLLMPTALLGLWALRRRLDVLALLAIPVLLMAIQYTLALDSGVRQRSGVEPLVVLIILAGWTSWSRTLRLGSAAIALLAPIVAIDLRTPAAAVPMLVGAAAIFVASRNVGRDRSPVATGAEPV